MIAIACNAVGNGSSSNMLFIGADLGWQSGPSGLCSLVLQNDTLQIQSLCCQPTLEAVLGWVDKAAPAPVSAIIGVDAPLIIPNKTGMRSPDRLAHKYFGKYHAGCYPANQNSPFAARLTQFSHELAIRGFGHGTPLDPQQSGRYQIEVFPHPATIQLFNLSRILKYKKGRLADRAKALNQLRDYMLQKLPTHEPALVLSDLPTIPTTGKAMKAVEDQLDSLMCAYVSAYWWYWGTARNQVLGSTVEGYIVIPCPPDAPVSTSSFQSI